MNTRVLLLIGATALLCAGCDRPTPRGSIILTQTPLEAVPPAKPSVLDLRYPPGSRVVLLVPPFRADKVRVLSGGLAAAGDPCLACDARSVFFAGKSSKSGQWQIYRAKLGSGRPEVVTHMPGGAMDPAVAAHGELIFSSPVPRAGRLWSSPQPAALYGQLPHQVPRRLTYAPESAVDASVLRDGRVLFVSVKPRENRRTRPHLCLYTISNDGTEITAFACQDDGGDFIRRPRELGDGRTAFIAGRTLEPDPMDWAESVRSAAPFATRGRLFPFQARGFRSVEPLPGGDLLACIETTGWVGRAMMGDDAVFRIGAGAGSLGAPIFDDPQRNSIEAIPVVAREAPAGHTSAVKPALDHGTVLCLDVNDSNVAAFGRSGVRAAALRVFAIDASGRRRVLGKVPVAPDGSVIVELPINVPLGFDTLDSQGRVLRHQPAFPWLRAGENHACIGCHEPRSHAPRNVRPQAVLLKQPRLAFADQPGTGLHTPAP